MTDTITRQRQEANRVLLTDLGIRRMKPPSGGQELIWDTAQKGLALLVSPGGAKAFRSQFKLDGRWLTRTIGRFGEMTEEQGDNISVALARETVRKDRALAAQGIDPREGKKPQASTRFGDVVDQFIEQHARPRQRTWQQTERVLKVNCAAWASRPIASIAKRDAYALLDGFIAEGQGPKAQVTLSWLRTMWKWAYRRDLVAGPLMDQIVIEYEKHVRDRVYSDDELKSIWRAAGKLDPVRGAYVKVMLLLAPRKTALAQMRRQHLDSASEPTLWTTPFELTKSKKTSAKKRVYLTPLPPLAQRILKGIRASSDAPDLVFPGRHKGTAIDIGTPLVERLIEHGAPSDFYFHAIRHTMATWLQDHGHSEYEIGLVLNHSGSGVTAGYSHGYPLDLKRALLTKWSDHVEQQLVSAEGVALLR